jgi:hypothetical protein
LQASCAGKQSYLLFYETTYRAVGNAILFVQTNKKDSMCFWAYLLFYRYINNVLLKSIREELD